MGSPKHLWSGNWEEESAAAAARRSAPVQAPPPDDPPPAPRPAAAPRPRRPRDRKITARRSLAVGAVTLVAALVAITVIALGNSGPSRGTAHASGPVWLGVELRDAPGGGAAIVGVFGGGPAQAAGLAPGDVIVAVNHTPVNSTADVNGALARRSPGDVVPVRALRGPSSFTAQVQLATRPPGYRSP